MAITLAILPEIVFLVFQSLQLTSLQSIQPDVSSHKQIPCQHVGPLFGHEIRIIGDHVHKSGLAVFCRIKNIVELEQRCSRSRLDNRGRHNEKMKQGKENDDICKEKKAFSVESTIRINSKKFPRIQNPRSVLLTAKTPGLTRHSRSLTHLSHDLFGDLVIGKQDH